jgi:hypothetical protein
MSKSSLFKLVRLAAVAALAFPGTVGFASPGRPAIPAFTAIQAPEARLANVGATASGLRINEVLFHPLSGQTEWVEILNAGASPVSMRGYSLTDEDGNHYRLPDSLPDVPSGAFVRVNFDGLGTASDETNFGDNLAVLHSPPGVIHIFDDALDQVSLYSASSFLYLPVVMHNSGGAPAQPLPSTPGPASPLISFVAWGHSTGGDDGPAARAGLWPNGASIGVEPIPGADPMLEGGSLGVYANPSTGSLEDWVIYGPGQTTPGMANGLQAPFLRNPPDEITTDDHQMAFGWSIVNGATSYRLQVDDDPNFGSPALNVEMAGTTHVPAVPFADGTFHFRVKALGPNAADSGYSAADQVTFMTASQLHSPVAVSAVLTITPKLQHKDTLMLDLDGSPETGQARWDSAHETDGDAIAGNGTAVRANALDNMYCTRASISMIVGYHGGNLSMDRISYEGYGGGAPEGDLGHGIGLWPNELANQGTGKNVFNWAMNGNAVTSSRGKPTFAQVKTFIDAGRPLLTVENGDSHSVVLNGYLEFAFLELAHRIDPWTATGSWVLYSSWSITEYHAPPAGVTPRSDENVDGDGVPDTIDDTDGDGVSDFDEVNRFHGVLANLSRTNPDSDHDLVPDKLDMRAYLFANNGAYSRINADVDGDGDRMETDRDNDNVWNTGSLDGCEDTNHNGRLDGTGETSNFNPAEDQEKDCDKPTVTITGPPNGSNDADCLIDLAGTVDSPTALTYLTASVTADGQSSSFDIGWSGVLPDFSFGQDVPLFSGTNLIIVTAINEGASGDAFIFVECDQAKDIHIQLTWPLLGSDVDLHFIRPGGTYFTAPGDTYYGNPNPDWGVQGDPGDNPLLDVDCITDCTVENITLSRPETGVFTIKVHYYSDHGLGATSATVKVWVRGALTTYGPFFLGGTGTVWDVATITWPPVAAASSPGHGAEEYTGPIPEK